MATCPTCGTEEIAGQQFCSSCGSPTSSVYTNLASLPSFPAQAMPSTGGSLAGFWIRFLGFFIDGLLLFGISTAFLFHVMRMWLPDLKPEAQVVGEDPRHPGNR